MIDICGVRRVSQAWGARRTSSQPCSVAAQSSGMMLWTWPTSGAPPPRRQRSSSPAEVAPPRWAPLPLGDRKDDGALHVHTLVAPPPPTTKPPSSSGYDLVGQVGGVFVFPTNQSGGFFGSSPVSLSASATSPEWCLRLMTTDTSSWATTGECSRSATPRSSVPTGTMSAHQRCGRDRVHPVESGVLGRGRRWNGVCPQ